MNRQRHPFDQLLDLLDDRLDPEARGSVDEHVRGCAVCQREMATLAAGRTAVRTLTPPPLPEGLEARILDAINAEDRAVTTPPRPADVTTPPASPRRPWTVAVLGTLAAVIVLAVTLWWRPTSDLPDAAAAHVSAYGARQLTLSGEIATAETAQAYFAQRVAFPVRVFDLGMMGYTIAGAGVLDLKGRPAAGWIYRGEAGWLLCEMFLGKANELPAATETRSANGIVFHIYHRNGGTQVFWEEGDVLCVLASTLSAEDVVQLAIAKAMKV